MDKKTLLALSLALVVAGCEGKALYQPGSRGGAPPADPLTPPPNEDGAGGVAPDAPPPVLVGASGARRLTRQEYDNTLRDLLGDTTRLGSVALPIDASAPYDNGYREQQPSQALIEAAERLATEAAARAMADPARRKALVGCTPQSPSDATCMRQFITTFGRRALRRPLEAEEISRYLSLQSYAVEANDFYYGAQLVLAAMLQSPKFLYRIEFGTPVETEPGVYRLSPYELASRLSYFLWGSTPPDWLLDLAGGGQLSTPDQVRAAAERLLSDARAHEQVQRFHAFWLGYYDLPHAPALSDLFRAESAALVSKVVLEDRTDHFELFRATSTYVGDALATHYGLPSPGAGKFAWVSYGAQPRQGILSHGAFLSAGVKALDSSPTLRGKYVRERLFCQELPPPPSTVNTDDGPPEVTTSPCKEPRYRAISQSATCAACHQNMDPIGFGLENFDREGRYRAHEDEQPTCAISGEGEVVGTGNFVGPAGLSEMLISSGVLQPCVVKQVYRFAMGRDEEPRDLGLLQKLDRQFGAQGRRFDRLLVDLVSDETFAYRREE